MCFVPYLGVREIGGGGALKGLGHNMLMQSTLCSSTTEISKTDFFYILAIHND